MDFFDKLGKQASKTYKYTAQKTSKLAREAKLKMQMNEHKDEIEDLYLQIGKKLYEHHVKDKGLDIDIEAVLEEYCIQIDELCDRIEEERKEILTLKDKKQCPNCFCEIELDYNYCPNCGDEQNEEFVHVEENIKELYKEEQIKEEKLKEDSTD